MDIHLRFTRNWNIYKNNPALKYLANNIVFDYLKSDSDGDEYPLSFRAVRFQLANGDYEAVVTNLNRD